MLKLRNITAYLLAFAAPLVAGEIPDAPVPDLVKAMAAGEFRGYKVAGLEIDLNTVSPYGLNLNLILSKGRAALPHLQKMILEPDPKVVIAAADCIQLIGDAKEKLAAAAEVGKLFAKLKGPMLAQAIFVQAQLTGKLPVKLVPEQLGKDTIWLLLRWLAKNPLPGLEPEVLPLMSNPEIPTRFVATAYLAAHGKSNAVLAAALQRMGQERESFIQQCLLKIIIHNATAAQARPFIAAALQDKRWESEFVGLQGVVSMKLSDLLPQVEAVLASLQTKPKEEAEQLIGHFDFGRQLGALGTPAALELLLKWAKGADLVLKKQAALGLPSFSDPRAVQALLVLADDEVAWLRRDAIAGIFRFPPDLKGVREAESELASRQVLGWAEKYAVLAGLLHAKDYDRAATFLKEKVSGDPNAYEVFSEAHHILTELNVNDARAGQLCADWFKNSQDKNMRLWVACNKLISATETELPEFARPFESLLDSIPEGVIGGACLMKRVHDVRRTLPNDEPSLVPLLDDQSLERRVAAAQKLGEVGTAAALPALERATQDPAFTDNTFSSLRRIRAYWTGEPLPPGAYPVRVAAHAAVDAIKGRK